MVNRQAQLMTTYRWVAINLHRYKNTLNLIVDGDHAATVSLGATRRDFMDCLSDAPLDAVFEREQRLRAQRLLEQAKPPSTNITDTVAEGLSAISRSLSKSLSEGFRQAAPVSPGEVVILTTEHETADVSIVPIELFVPDDSGRRFGLHPDYAVANSRPGAPLVIGDNDASRLLILGSASGDSVLQRQFEREATELQATQDGPFSTQFNTNASFADLRAQTGSFGVIELWVHGRVTATGPELRFSDGWIPGVSVCEELTRLTPRLVILRSCSSGKGSYQSLAAQVQAAGIAAVIGMRWDVGVLGSSTFLASFHRQLFAGLTAGRSIQHVVQLARIETLLASQTAYAWFCPTLWVHPNHHGSLFPEYETPAAREAFAACESEIRIQFDRVQGSTIIGGIFEDCDPRSVAVNVGDVDGGVIVAGIGGSGNREIRGRAVTNGLFIGSATPAAAAFFGIGSKRTASVAETQPAGNPVEMETEKADIIAIETLTNALLSEAASTGRPLGNE